MDSNTALGKRIANEAQPSSSNKLPTVRVLNGAASFNGDCEECRPFCAAVCCRGYAIVALTEEEAMSGKYRYRVPTEGCTCLTCTKMRELGVRYSLRKLPDGSCIHLDGARKCSIYDDRPATCRKYSCVNLSFSFVPLSI
jgi:Fe-S-cluster containining protein